MKFLASLFKNKPTVKDVKTLTDSFLDVKKENIHLHMDSLNELVKSMSSVVKDIKKQSNDYPNNSINAKVWLDGFSLIESARLLYEYLNQTSLTSYTERAADLWAESTLIVCSHYHHMVGPSMIAAAEMKEKVGDLDTALIYYNAVIDDFKDFININFDEEPPNDDDIVVLKSLKQAIIKTQNLNQNENLNHQELLSVVKNILKNSVEKNN